MGSLLEPMAFQRLDRSKCDFGYLIATVPSA